MFSEEQDYADIQEKDFLQEESSLPGRKISVDWSEGSDGKSIIVAAPPPK